MPMTAGTSGAVSMSVRGRVGPASRGSGGSVAGGCGLTEQHRPDDEQAAYTCQAALDALARALHVESIFSILCVNFVETSRFPV